MEEMVPSNLNLFSTRPTQLSINESKYEHIGTKTALDGTTAQLEFTANADKVYYTDLNSSFLLIKCKYTMADGSAIPAAPTIGPIQAPATSMFKSMDMWINDMKVTPNESNMAFINFIHMFMQSQQAKDTYLSLALWYDDTYTTIATANQDNPQAAADTNKGLKSRANAFGGGKEVVLLTRIYIPPHMCDRLFLPNCKFDYKFEMNSMEFFSMSSAAAGTYRFMITDAAILLQRVAVSPSVSLVHAQLLQNHNAVYPCKYMVSRTYNIGIGSFDFKFENAFVGKDMPVSVYVMFMQSDAKQGSLTQNPYIFRHINLKSLVCRMGTKKFPAIDVKLNPAQNQTQMVLWDTIMALDCYGSNVGPGGFDRDTFGTGLFIAGFDLSRDANTMALYHNSSFEASNVSFEGAFSVATAAAFTVLVLGQFHGQIELNKFMMPFTSWG